MKLIYKRIKAHKIIKSIQANGFANIIIKVTVYLVDSEASNDNVQSKWLSI